MIHTTSTYRIMKAALLMLAFVPLYLFADGEKISDEPKRFLDNVVAGNKSNNMTIIQTNTSDNPYANRKPEMYAKVVKQFGWFKGYGKPLTTEEARHHSLVYRFSNMNKAGNWTKMEALDAYGDLSTGHGMMPYLYNAYDDTDSGGNQEWADKLKSACYWEFLADGTGKKCIMERAHDEDGNLIYCYMPTYVSDNEIIGQYIDAWGLPAAFRVDSVDNGNGTMIAQKQIKLIYIMLDKNGNDSVMQHRDSYGLPCPNADGAMMERNFYKNGRRVKAISCDMLGNPIKDNWGNCGWEQELDKNGNTIKYTVIGTDGKPMRMPHSDRSTDEYISYKCVRDKWGNEIERIYTLGDDKETPDTISSGIHRIVHRYDDRGNVIYKAGYDLNGNLHAYTNNTAFEKKEFNNKGYRTLFEAFTPEGNYIDTSTDHYCKMETGYDKNNKVIRKRHYVAIDNQLSLFSSFDKIGNKETFWLTDSKRCYIDSLDNKGRLVSRRYYDSDWTPVVSKTTNAGYHRKLITYRYDKRTHIASTTEEFFDVEGNPVVPSDILDDSDVEDYTRAVTVVDSTFYNTSILKNNVTDVTESYRLNSNKDFSEVLSQQSTNDFGVPARSRSNDGLLYYKGKRVKLAGNKYTVVGYNEFDEPAFITDSKKNVYCYFIKNDNDKGNDGDDDDDDDRTYYDENMQPIHDMSYFVQHLPEAYIIEVNDSVGYDHGLKDGDVILRYGNWVTNMDATHNYEGELLLEEVLSAANDSIDVWLMRHHPEENRSEIITMKLPGKTITELGFTHHRVYYTKREKIRQTNCLQEFLAGNRECDITATRLREMKNDCPGKTVMVVMPYKGKRSTHTSYYRSKRRNPMLYLAMHAVPDPNWVQKNPDVTWTANQRSKEIDTLLHVRNTTDYFEIVMSDNGKTVRKDSLSWSQREGLEHFNLSIPNNRVGAFNRLLRASERNFPEILYNRDTRTPIWDLLSKNYEKDNPHMDATEMARMFTSDYEGDIKFWYSEKNTTFSDNHSCDAKYSSNCTIEELHFIDLDDVFGSRIDSVRTIERYTSLKHENTWLETMRRLDKNIYKLVGSKVYSSEINDKSKLYFVRPAERGYSEIVRFVKGKLIILYGHFPYSTMKHLEVLTRGKSDKNIDDFMIEDIDFTKPDEAYAMAKKLIDKGGKKREYGTDIMIKLAEKGYDRAYGDVAEAYLLGLGVEYNKKKADKWYYKAINKGHFYNVPVVMSYDYEKEYYTDLKGICNATLKSCNDSIYKGWANYYLGLLYDRGLGVKKDSLLAERHFLAAKEEGNADAYRKLPYGRLSDIMRGNLSASQLMKNGQSYATKNPQLAHAYYLAAADSAHTDAYYLLGKMYADSTLTIFNKETAHDYYSMALASYKKLAEAGDASKWYDVADAYLNGEGVEKNREKAIEYYHKGIDGGSKLCAFYLAKLYDKEESHDEAFKYYNIGSEMGDKRCCYYVGRYYEYGFGNISRDMKSAEKYYRKAKGYNSTYDEYITSALTRLGVSQD